MKTLLASIILCAVAFAAAVQFAWDDPNPPNRIRGYRFYDVQAGTTNMLAEVPTKTYRGTFAPGDHIVWVTAVSNEGIESEPSVSVNFWVPHAITNFSVIIVPN